MADQMSIPPFEPPLIAILSAAAYLFFAKYSLEGASATRKALAGNYCLRCSDEVVKTVDLRKQLAINICRMRHLRVLVPFVLGYQQGATPYRTRLHPEYWELRGSPCSSERI